VIRKREKIREDQNVMEAAGAGTAKKNRTSREISTTPSTQEDIQPHPEIEELN